MQISFQRDELLKPLSFVAGVVERRQTLPILSYVLLRQDGQDVTLTGTDLEIEVVASGKSESRGSGELTLPARKLLDICRALPADAMVEVKREGEKAIVKAGRSRFTLLTLPAADFPSLEVGQWDITFAVMQKKLKEALTQTHFCMAQQDVRYYLNGLLFEIHDGRLRLVGTDGHRMALTEIEVRGDAKGERQVIVPRKGVQEMIRLLEDADSEVEVGLSSNHLQAKTTGFIFRSKLIDGRYPDYNKVLPGTLGKHAIVERENFRESLGRAAILSNEKYRGVRLNFQGKALKISAHNPEQEEAQDEIGVDYHGDALEIGFNVNYVLEAVGALGGERIKMGLNDPNASCLLTVPDQTFPQYVIMPMRL